jgi:hypothetical protein
MDWSRCSAVDRNPGKLGGVWCWPTLRRIAARIATAVDFVQTGQIVTVDVATL